MTKFNEWVECDPWTWIGSEPTVFRDGPFEK
jgi:hypothetical protein